MIWQRRSALPIREGNRYVQHAQQRRLVGATVELHRRPFVALRWAERSHATIQSGVGTTDGTKASGDDYYGYGTGGAAYGANAPAGAGGPASTPPAAAAAADYNDADGWPGSAAEDGSAGAGDYYNGWQQDATTDAYASGWTGPTEWGEYEAPGEWGQQPRVADGWDGDGEEGGGPTGAAGPSSAWGEEGAARGYGGDGFGAGAGAQQQQQPGAEGQEWPGFGSAPGGMGGFDADSYRSGPPPPGGSSWGQQQQQQQQGGARGSWGGGGGAALLPSDITLITPRDAELVLPVLPTNDQARHYQPRSVPE
jgi:hypothetical protein